MVDKGQLGTGHSGSSSVAPFHWRPWAGLLILICCVPLILLGAGFDLSTTGSAAPTECIAGCDDYATKPINRTMLIETIRQHGVGAKAVSTTAT